MPPTAPPVESVWSHGSRTVSQARAETGLSGQELWRLMGDGTLPWFAHGGRGTRFIAWKALVEYLEALHREHAGKGA
jgi:hypothetical protein